MRGSKTKYKPDFPKLAEAYAKEGMVDKEIAKKLGISLSSFYKYQNDHSEFSDALKRGKAPVDEGVEQSLLKRAMGFEFEETTVEYLPVLPGAPVVAKSVKKVKKIIVPDVTACIFWLKNRIPKRWRDKQEHDVLFKGALSMSEMKKSLKEFDEDGV